MLPLARISPRPAAGVTCVLITLCFSVSSVAIAESVLLNAPDDPQPSRVKVVFEVDGELLPQASESDTEPVAIGLRAKGDFVYEERVAKDQPGRALRYYEQAEAAVAVSGKPRQSTLREDRRLIAVDADAAESPFRALQGALTREELELIELPGGSHLADRLLPGREVKVGETWTHDDQLLASLLNLSSVTVNEVTSQLQGIDKDRQVAQLTIRGKLLGYAAGVVSEVQLRGKYNVDLQNHRVVWLAFAIREERGAGPTKPGLKVQARVRMLVEETLPQQLSAESLPAMLAGAPEPTNLLEYSPEQGRFTLLHDRRWHVFSETPDLIIMRMIEDGQLIAQCNLRSLPPGSGGQNHSLSHFQTEIRTALGSAAEQIVDSQESTRPDGSRQLRVAVVGQVAHAPIHWIYYQLTDTSGQLVTCVFTMSGQRVDRFGAEDISFVSSLTLRPTDSEAVDEEKKVARGGAEALD